MALVRIREHEHVGLPKQNYIPSTQVMRGNVEFYVSMVCVINVSKCVDCIDGSKGMFVKVREMRVLWVKDYTR